MKISTEQSQATLTVYEEFNNEYYTEDFDLEATGEDWEYENCSWNQAALTFDSGSSRAFDPSRF